MDMNDVLQNLNILFKDYILKYEIQNYNEIQIQVDFYKIYELCLYINTDLKLELVSMFANDERNLECKSFAIYYIFGLRKSGNFLVLKSVLPVNTTSYPSVSKFIYSASGYEREIKDLFGLEALGNQNLRNMVFHGNWPDKHFPLRKDFNTSDKIDFVNKPQTYEFVKGEGVFEIPVGPVHAGIIEPGHFRFSVAGENVLRLEAQLYFTHKGIEKLAESMNIEQCFYLSERISGDETFSNSLAFCQAVEKIAKVQVPCRALNARVFFAELERLTSHLGDLAGICLDVAYGFGAFQFRMLRGWAFLLADELCGMRFLRSVNKPGGIRKNFIRGKENNTLEYIKKIEDELIDTINILKLKRSFISRIDSTGVLKNEIAVVLNVSGPAARASAINFDIRKAFPYANYQNLNIHVPLYHKGDVNCRMLVKMDECLEALSLMRQIVNSVTEGNIFEAIGDLPKFQSALGYTESPRGENIHWVMVGENNTIFRYKIRTPSFCNWPALCHAVVGNIVPDFPVINKSFNLSYAGNDL